MIYLRIVTLVLILLALAACEQHTTSDDPQRRQGTATANTQATQAIETLKARLAMNPNDFAALSSLGDLYFESQQYIDAFNTYDKAIAVNPMCADCYNDRGLCLYYLGDPVSALESFDKAVSIDPNYKHAWLSKGYVLTTQGRYAEAVEPLNKVKELDGDGPLSQQADKFLAMGAQSSP
jgi:tetratricopeptide (TPR) repeat protein